MRKINCLSVIIPFYGGGDGIDYIFTIIANLNLGGVQTIEIIIVGNKVTEHIRHKIESFKNQPLLKLVYHQCTSGDGKGEMIKSALPLCSGEFILVHDDVEAYQVKDWSNMIRPVLKGEADIVFGSRFVGSTSRRILSFWRNFKDKFLTAITNSFTNLNLSDVNCGLKLVSRSVVEKISLEQKGFEFEYEFCIKASQIPDIRIYEVGVSYHGSKTPNRYIITWIKSLYSIVKYADFSKLVPSRLVNAIPAKYYFYLVFILGMIIRLRQYFANRSFWIDEAALAINIRDRDYSQLLETLEYRQVSPIGFLYIEKFLTNTFGQSELVYRLFPIIASIFSIWLLYKLFLAAFNKEIALMSSILFILSTSITYYSSELKQYSSDIFFALLILWLYMAEFGSRKIKTTLIIGITGAIGVWFSNIIIIIFASIWLMEILQISQGKNLKLLLKAIPAYLFWIISFAIYYNYFIHNNPHTEGMKIFWMNKFVPTNSFPETMEWIWFALMETFRKAIGFYQELRIPLYLFITGILISAITKRSTLIFFLPIIIHFILSALQMYPYDNRLVMYLLPFYIVFIAVTIDFISKFLLLKKAHILIAIAILYSITGLYRGKAKDYFKKPYMREHIRPTLAYVEKNMKKDDIIYVYYGSLRPFRFYEPGLNFNTQNIIKGRHPKSLDKAFIDEIEGLSGRVWFIFSHSNPGDGISYIENEVINDAFLNKFETDGSKTYLVNK